MVSSANCRWDTLVLFLPTPKPSNILLFSALNTSTTIVNRKGDIGSPCLNPLVALTHPLAFPFTKIAKETEDKQPLIQWFQERGSFTVRGEVFALRRWSPEENSVVRGKFRRGWLELRGLPFHLWDEVQLSHILQQWGRVTKVARNSLKFVDLSKVTLRVEMLPKVVLPALLEVEDGDWTYTVAVTVTGEDDGEDDGGDSIKPESSRSKDELRSAGGCVLQKPQMVEGLRAIDRTSDCQRWMPRHRLHFSSSDSKSAKGEKGKGSVSSSSKLQRPGLSAKNKASEGLPQVSSKTKGSPVSVRRRARSGPPRFDEASSSPKRSFEGGGSLVTNRDISRGKSHSRKSDFSTAVSERDLPLSGAFEPNSYSRNLGFFGSSFLCHSSSSYPLESSHAFQRGEASFPVQEPSTLPLEGFQVEGLTPRKMVKVQSVLESLRVRIVRDNGKGVEGENRNPLCGQDFKWNTRGLGSRKKRRTVRRFLSTQNPDVVMLQETKREIWDRRLVSSIWKGKSLDWVALPACGASGGIVILWDSVKFNCSEKVLGSFSVTVKLNSDEEGSFWLTSVYGPNKAVWREDFWLELQDLHGLTFPRWCVGGDFNVIRRISEKMGDSRLTVNMRRFDEFIRESEALPRWTSDHSPICLETNPFMWGPTPFRFENMWLLHPEFKEKFRDWWQECTVEGWEGHKFMRKLKFIKSKLKEWNTRVFGDLRERKKHILTDLGRIDRIEQEGNLNLELSGHWKKKQEVIKSLISERGETLNNIEVISEEIVNFFGNLIPNPKAVFEEEVRMAVFQLNKEKAPGPDGFTLAVYQECWDVIKEDLMRVFFEFHTKGVINQSTNATFIAMVPKKSQTFKISDYRPISLVTSLYKIIAKVLSGRLRKVLHETIFGSQGAFVEGRQILDAVLIANEVVDEKRRKGFSQKWRSWMRGCLSSSSFAILVNGNAKGWVKASRGLRQGDPLSPFLFTLVADVLSRLMIRAEETGITEGFLVGRDRTRVSLLQFADDTIFFSKASLDLLQNLKIILLVFGQVSGLKINLEKSTISGINTRQEMLSSLALVLECRVSEWPLSYLGLPLGGNPKTIGFWDPVVERISRRLDGWKKAYLSLGGRITLIQSCLSHIPSYFLSLFKIPVSIASKIEKMQRDFLWSGAGEGKRDHLIRWEVVSRPREMGGLGFGKTSMRNSALLGKWLWRFPRERSGLWHKVIASIYGTHPNGWDANMVVRWSHRCPWKAIAQVFQEFSPFVRLVVGNGERIRFWEDLWWGNQTLCAQFAELYRVISVRNLTVSNVLGNSFPLSWNFNFRRNLTDSEIDLLQRLMSSLHSVLLSPSHQTQERGLCLRQFLWSSKVPSKVKALAWLVAHGKVNTNDKLQLRRPYKALCPQWCILCKGNGESIDHLFLHCPVTIGLWHRLFNLVGVIWVPPRSIEDMLVISLKAWGTQENGRGGWDLIRFTLLYGLLVLKLLEEFL
ncbi:putative ribonuclease H protein [Vitis vinifera]|uniref:Putative ribonuclease H protein n=1 Tax=Vitis vinifera TaxID=29760 RepID=A0A438BWL9_VITVI|nr:putative ribonuclease H protein [Vitis vinifera]